LRVVWSVLRNSEFGEQDVSTIGAEDRDQILKLFSIPKRDAVADVLHSVFLWATGSADTTHSTRGIDAKPDSSSSSVAPKQRFEERELAAAEQITAPAEDEPVVELEMQGASSLGFDTDDAAPDVAPCLDALRSTTDTRSGKRKKPNPLAMHAAMVARGHVDDRSGKGGEVLSEAIDVPGAAVGAAAADVSEDVVADDVVDMADVAVAADLADDATILDELADVLAVARSDVLAVARGLADELADVLVVADDVVAVDVVAVDLADDIADVELTEDVVVERQSATEPASGADETSTEENTPSPRPGLVKRAPTAERWIDPRFDRRTGAACTDKAASRRKRAASKLRGRRARRGGG